MPDIATNFSENVIWVGAAGFEADNDRLIILQDAHRSGYECQTCLDENKHTVEGREVSTVPCAECHGEGRRPKAGNSELTVKCSDCEGRGWKVCPDCSGKGGAIILADNSKNRPTTGTIVSIGPEVGRKCLVCGGTGDNSRFKVEPAVPTSVCLICKGLGLTPTRKRGDRVIYPSFAGHAYDLSAITAKGKTVEVVLVILRDSEIISRMYGMLEQNQVKRSAALHTVA